MTDVSPWALYKIQHCINCKMQGDVLCIYNVDICVLKGYHKLLHLPNYIWCRKPVAQPNINLVNIHSRGGSTRHNVYFLIRGYIIGLLCHLKYIISNSYGPENFFFFYQENLFF